LYRLSLYIYTYIYIHKHTPQKLRRLMVRDTFCLMYTMTGRQESWPRGQRRDGQLSPQRELEASVWGCMWLLTAAD
jgi:hypothetical protein